MYDLSITKSEENGKTISVFSIAVPKFFELVFTIMLGTVNTLMLSAYSENGVTATGVANQIENFAIVIINTIISGMAVVSSVELGKKNRSIASRIAGTAFVATCTLSLVLGLTISLSSKQISAFMNLESEALSMAARYMRIRSSFLVLRMAKSVLNNLLICNGYAIESFVLGVATNIINVAYGYIVLYSPLAEFTDGIVALGFSPLVVEVITGAMAVYIFKKRKCPFRFCFDTKKFLRIMRIGLPGGLGLASFAATGVFTTAFVASVSAAAVNAKVYVTNIVNYTCQAGYAISYGHGVIVGRCRGREEFDKIKKLHKQNVVLCTLCNLAFSLIVFALRYPLISLFTDDAQIIKIASGVFLVDTAVEIARAVNNVSEKSLNANGDVLTTLIVPLFTCWFFGVFAVYILSVKLGLGLMGCWIGFALDETAKALLYVFRWRSGKWKRMKI